MSERLNTARTSEPSLEINDQGGVGENSSNGSTIEPIKLVLIDQSRDAEDAARDQADRRLTEELNQGSGARRFLNGIWKGNIAKDYYRQKYVKESLGNIQEAQDVLLYEETSQNKRAQALEATIQRFQGKYDELIHTEAGESREVNQVDSELSSGAKDLIRRYCLGELNDETLVEERTRLLNDYRQNNSELNSKQGIVTVDNMLAVAQTVAGAVEHGESLDNVLNNTQVISGEARTGVRTEVNYNKVDTVIAKLAESKIGSLVGPELIATATTVTASALRVGSHSVVGAATKTILPGVAAGLWAGLRENRRVKDERAQHAREMAQGKEFNDGDKRRTEVEAARYQTILATDLEQHLREVSSGQILDEGGSEALRAALDALVAVETRVKMSDSERIDLISYSETATIGDERLRLDLARAEAKIALDTHLTSDARQALDISQEASLQDIINGQSASLVELVKNDIFQKDEAFKKLKRSRVAEAAAVGVVTGIVIGGLAQEAGAAIDPTRAGLIEQAWGAKTTTIDGTEHQTLLAGLGGRGESVYTEPSDEYTPYPLGSNGEISVSSDHTIVDNGDGTISFQDPNGNFSAEHVTVNPDGSLPDESIDQLSKVGMIVNDQSYNTENIVTETQQVSGSEYVQNHLDETTRVTRDLWYDNNTVSVFDKNELGLHWGGNNGLTADGYQYSVSTMTADGSYHGGEAVDWSQANQEGALKLAISGTEDTQTQVFMLDINPDGTVDIPQDSPAAQFFSEENGRAVFHGKYSEVVQVTGVDENGVTHMRPLATHVGDANPGTITDQVTTTTIEHHNVYNITTGGYETETYTEMAPIIPVVPRRSLETVRAREKGAAYNYYGHNSEQWENLRNTWEQQLSPRLQQNPNAILQPKQELDFLSEAIDSREKTGWYQKGQYAQEINDAIDQSRELSNLDAETRAIVVMPVAAAFEQDNIYKTLSLYGQQDKDALKSTTLLLNLNWIEGVDQDQERADAIQKTVSEIERARNDFPDLKIATMQKIWPKDWVDNVRKGSIYGEVIKTTYDTAAMAVRRSVNDGRLDANQDVLLITNDADANGMHRHYLRNYIKAEAEHKDSDAFVGAIRWGTSDTARRYPGFYIAQSFMQSMNVAAARASSSIYPSTIGPNAAFRVSTYAAIGGCDDRDDLGVGADSVLGRKVLAARGEFYSNPRSSYGAAPSQQTDTNDGAAKSVIAKKVIRQVTGSDVDSSPERLLDKGYRVNRFIPRAWDKFDSGETRETVREDELIGPESVRRDFGRIRDRVESQISGFINEWYPDVSLASFTLQLFFPDIKKGDNRQKAWQLETDSGGKYKFRLTDEGARQLRTSLLRDPLAGRLSRNLDSAITRRGLRRQRPISVNPRLVRPLG